MAFYHSKLDSSTKVSDRLTHSSMISSSWKCLQISKICPVVKSIEIPNDLFAKEANVDDDPQEILSWTRQIVGEITCFKAELLAKVKTSIFSGWNRAGSLPLLLAAPRPRPLPPFLSLPLPLPLPFPIAMWRCVAPRGSREGLELTATLLKCIWTL